MGILYIAQPDFMRIEFEAPSAADVTRALHMLDGVNNLYVGLGPGNHNDLTIFATLGEKRYVVQDSMYGWLVDDAIPHHDEETRLDYTWENGQVDDVPLWQSVTLEKANEVALFFFEHQKSPRHMKWYNRWHGVFFPDDTFFD